MDNIDKYGRIIRSDNSQARIKELESQIKNLQEQVRKNRDDNSEIVKITNVGTVLFVICGIIGLIITFMSHWFFGILLILISILWLFLKEEDEFRDWFINAFDL